MPYSTVKIVDCLDFVKRNRGSSTSASRSRDMVTEQYNIGRQATASQIHNFDGMQRARWASKW